MIRRVPSNVQDDVFVVTVEPKVVEADEVPEPADAVHSPATLPFRERRERKGSPSPFLHPLKIARLVITVINKFNVIFFICCFVLCCKIRQANKQSFNT